VTLTAVEGDSGSAYDVAGQLREVSAAARPADVWNGRRVAGTSAAVANIRSMDTLALITMVAIGG
jgi:hypothetical protein